MIDAGDPPNDAFEAPDYVGQSLAAGNWLWTWQVCVAQQADRVLRPAPNVEPDAEACLFVVALRQMLRAVEWAEKLTSEDRGDLTSQQRTTQAVESRTITEAIATFTEAVPGLSDVRNMIEHFDAYERGEGNLQRRAIAKRRQAVAGALAREVDGEPKRPPKRAWPTLDIHWVRRSQDDYAIAINGNEVDVRSAAVVSQPLVQTALDALARWRAIVDPVPGLPLADQQ